MPISAGLREDIAVYRGFIGQQYIRIATMENIRQKVRWKQTFIQKAPMLGAFKNELSCIFSYVTIQLNTCYSPLWRTGVWGEDYFLT